MADKTGISWTNSTWNAIRGCTPVSPGCKNCYAAKVAQRFSFPGGPFEGLVRINAAGERTDDWNGEIKFVEEHLLDPIRWKRPRRIFVNSVSDLFHHNVSDAMIDKIFAVMALAPQHTFQVLTKRPERMMEYLSEPNREENIQQWVTKICLENLSESYVRQFKSGWGGLPLGNAWLGTSVENQKYADLRIPFLLQTPAAVRFISAEPLLGTIDLRKIVLLKAPDRGVPDVSFDSLKGWNGGEKRPYKTKLDWVIVGGESQRGSRPMEAEWAISIMEHCKASGVAFFMKQGSKANWTKYNCFDSFPKELKVREYPDAI